MTFPDVTTCISNVQSSSFNEQLKQVKTETVIPNGNNLQTWDLGNASNVICNNNAIYIPPQLILQTNSSVQHIVIHQSSQQLIYQPQEINSPGYLIQQQASQPHQQVFVQQLPTASSSSIIMNSPAVGSTVDVPTQTTPSSHSQEDTIHQVINKLKTLQIPAATPTMMNSSFEETLMNKSVLYTPSNNYMTLKPTIKQEYDSNTPTLLTSNIKKESNIEQNYQWNSPILAKNIKKEPESDFITPVSSPVIEASKPKERSTIVVNLSDFKPISSHYEDFKNNKPAVLKYVNKKNNVKTRKRHSTKRIIKKSTCYKCDTCQKEFLKYYQLKSHLIIHMTEKPYKCEFCPRAFCRKHDLSRHERIHTGDTPYFCSICFKGFARSDACTRHIRQNLCKRNVISYNPETGNMELAI